MKTATLQREPSSDQGTYGVLRFGEQQVYTIELPWRGNLPKVSCIPPGSYRCEIAISPHFGRVYEIKDVPGRSHVLIHSANLAGDSSLGWTTELQGCIAVGERRGRMLNAAGQSQRAVLVSRPALRRFMLGMAGEPFTLEVKS